MATTFPLILPLKVVVGSGRQGYVMFVIYFFTWGYLCEVKLLYQYETICGKTRCEIFPLMLIIWDKHILTTNTNFWHMNKIFELMLRCIRIPPFTPNLFSPFFAINIFFSAYLNLETYYG